MRSAFPTRLDPLSALPEHTEAPDPDPLRYRVELLLGQGGMGEVWRAWDQRLDRAVALKVMRRQAADRPSLRERFLEEARITAALQHPGVVAVYDQGELADGRCWYTMREVTGARTLRDLLDEGAGRPGEDGPRLRARITALLSLAQTVAWAHRHGVVHRDLKPDNVALGDLGEVLVLDWGLARREAAGSGDAVADGAMLGTLPYMPPEQAGGRPAEHGPWSDVYALGAMLYEVLAGRPMWQGDQVQMAAALASTAVDPLDRVAPEAPAELRSAAMACLSPEPTRRPADASWMVARLQAWLDGAWRREQALVQVARAEALRAEATAAQTEAEDLTLQAAAGLAALSHGAPPSAREPWWALQDEAGQVRERVADLEISAEQALRAGLEAAPHLPEAQEGLALLYRDQVVRAEREGRVEEARRGAARLRAHGHAPTLRWLDAPGALTLTTDPPGASVELRRHVLRGRRLVAEPVGSLGHTPLHAVDLPPGSWLLVLRHPGCDEVPYPVSVGRGEHWEGGPSGGPPFVLRLPRAGELGPDDRLVAGGPALLGGDPDAPDGLPRRRVWIDSFVLRRHPVTNEEYLAFLRDLADHRRMEEALRHAPQDRPGGGEVAHPILVADARGRFHLGADAAGLPWSPRWPVALVDWHGAMAFAAWSGRREGLPWRLPHDLEWEKAARGADGRRMPWGDHLDPGWACTSDSHLGPARQVDVDAFPDDISVYGVRGLAGNVRDLCLNPYERLPAERARLVVGPAPVVDPDTFLNVRGGAWSAAPSHCRVAGRVAARPGRRISSLGFRLCRSWASEG